jgi:hypothetical protein
MTGLMLFTILGTGMMIVGLLFVCIGTFIYLSTGCTGEDDIDAL